MTATLKSIAATYWLMWTWAQAANSHFSSCSVAATEAPAHYAIYSCLFYALMSTVRLIVLFEIIPIIKKDLPEQCDTVMEAVLKRTEGNFFLTYYQLA